MPEHNEKNIARLAEEIADGMDLKTMFTIIYDLNVEYYENDKEAFEGDWEDMEMEETDA